MFLYVDIKYQICLANVDILFFSIAEALAAVKNQTMSEAFMKMFLPNGQPPLSGMFTRRLDLAAILDEIASKGISEFYSGNLTQEMVAAVSLCCTFLPLEIGVSIPIYERCLGTPFASRPLCNY